MESVQINQSSYTYFAFVSYKREDEKWARWPKKLYSYRDGELDTVQVQDVKGKTLYVMSYKGRATVDLDSFVGGSEAGSITQSFGLSSASTWTASLAKIMNRS